MFHPLYRKKNEGKETGNVFNLLKSPTHLPGMRQGNYCGRIRWLLGHDKAPPRRRHRNVSSRFQRDYSLAVPGMGCVADSATSQENYHEKKKLIIVSSPGHLFYDKAKHFFTSTGNCCKLKLRDINYRIYDHGQCD